MTSPAPAEGLVTVDNVQQLLMNALVDAGITGIDEAVEQPVLNRAFTQANWLLAQWARKRALCYQLYEYNFTSTGAPNYLVGNGQTININPRPDRLEYAYLRLNPTAATPVDIRLDIIPSKEDYSRITVKTIGTLPWRIFYDPGWPVGTLYPWPVPAASLYQIFLGFKVVIPRFTSLQQKINFPPEYEAALNWCLARRLRVSYQMPMDPEINALARDALNAMRLANQAAPTLIMPQTVVGKSNSYDYRSDNMPG